MELLAYIPLGLLGLTLVVFVHEGGHFLAARWMGVEVEAFAIGWGTVLWRWKPNRTEYRICLLPLGGYCKMKGDEYLLKAIEAAQDKALEAPLPERGSFHSVSPWRRIIISVFGPLANLVLALLIFLVLAATGSPQHSTSPRIVLLEAPAGQEPYPAQTAGLRTGDLILKIDATEVRSFQDVQEAIAVRGAAALKLQVQREGEPMELTVTPRWIADQGRPLIGISDWVDPVLATVTPGSAADIAGLKAGDRIVQVEGHELKNTHDLGRILTNLKTPVQIQILRGSEPLDLKLIPHLKQGLPDLGVSFQLQTFPPHGKPLGTAVESSLKQTGGMIVQMATGLGHLVTGSSTATESLSGPLRISYLIGEQTSRSFGVGLDEGWSALAGDLAFLSLALFFMNLLPIPALDGGSILLHLFEGLRRRPTPIAFLLRYQQLGGLLILGLVAFTLYNDTTFLMGPK